MLRVHAAFALSPGASAGEHRPEAERLRASDDRGSENDVRQADPEMRHDDPAGRPLASQPSSASPMVAVGSG